MGHKNFQRWPIYYPQSSPRKCAQALALLNPGRVLPNLGNCFLERFLSPTLLLLSFWDSEGRRLDHLSHFYLPWGCHSSRSFSFCCSHRVTAFWPQAPRFFPLTPSAMVPLWYRAHTHRVLKFHFKLLCFPPLNFPLAFLSSVSLPSSLSASHVQGSYCSLEPFHAGCPEGRSGWEAVGCLSHSSWDAPGSWYNAWFLILF